MATIDDFRKIELVIGEVKEVKDHPNADKLFVVKVDTGKEIRQVVAGIKKSYKPEDLVGRQVVLVSNLDPAVIRGEESQGMILAASDENGICVLQPDKKVTLGSIAK